MMKISRPLMVTLIAVLLMSAGLGQASQNARPKNYPAIIKASPQRLTQVERDWQRLGEAYNVKDAKPELYPVIYTPRSLTQLQGAIKLLETQPQADLDIKIREAARRFVDRWRDLLNADPAMTSLTVADSTNGTHRLTYKQANYPFPIAGRFGELTLVIGNDGRLLQLDDRFIPLVDLPFKPAVDRQAVAQKLAGRTLAFKDSAGSDQQTKINNASEARVKGLVIFPIEKKDSLEIHLAWEIGIGPSSSGTIYVDAMDGEELKPE